MGPKIHTADRSATSAGAGAETTPRDRPRPRVLFISIDALGAEMTGAAIRFYELAKVLQAHADVTIASAESDAAALEDFPCIPFQPHDPSALRPHIAAADTIVAQPQWPLVTRWMHRSGARLIFDLYDPEALETIELFADASTAVRRLMINLATDRLTDALRIGHHFICASEVQRDLWLGAMLTERLLRPAVYDRDPSLRSVIDTVPFGIPAEPPQSTGAGGARSRFPRIGTDDEIVLWNGGIWNWLDAPTAVRAAGLLAEKRPKLRLVFMGAARNEPAKRATEETRALAGELGLLDRVVHFNDRWVPYAERSSWLLEADCAISTHREHLETRFAFRTRMLDCFWAGLPVVCTRGDALSERVEREDLGAAVPPGDAHAVAAALDRVLERGRAHYSEQLEHAAADHHWPTVAKALVHFVTSAELPPRLGARADGPHRRSPAHQLRSMAYRVTRTPIYHLRRARRDR